LDKYDLRCEPKPFVKSFLAFGAHRNINYIFNNGVYSVNHTKFSSINRAPNFVAHTVTKLKVMFVTAVNLKRRKCYCSSAIKSLVTVSKWSVRY
jgi:hypothetical protein